ncbi:hypothetical protein G7078_01350 [Sphingomonas sinipercae]|uniref:Porin domain-containing protein n=1 Tax=Sphingomonas sinipercae TaxID=2714944 RepID=A0A6G7ZKP4_9SPHN|nr:porin [Sphingomonas sinipercae]QIL01567.1 hypothetical protein G7078_01350 [Sphingomonas sinipercae]
MGRFSAGKVAAAAGVAALLLSPALAAPDSKRRAPSIAISADSGMSFTPATADPRLAAAFNRSASVGDFKFTPAAVKTRPSQLRVAIRARASGPTGVAAANSSASPVSALAPVTYSLGAAVGWRRFAVAGEVGKVSPAGSIVDGRESAAVGISYSLPRFTGRLAVSADRSERRSAVALREPDNVAVDLGGSYSLSRRIAVTGGVRYKVESDRLRALSDERVDSQAVYVGTAFKF